VSVVLFERRGSVALITLNRPEARNAVNPEVAVRLARAWEEVKGDPQIRAAVVTGAGDKSFCAGADLARLIPLFTGARAPEDEWDEALRKDPALSDRALLRLGFALGEKKQWDASRQAYETLIGRFGGSPWVHEARYGIGWAYQNQAQYDNAVNTYNQVVAATATRLGARAQLNIGICRHLQKRYADASAALLVVPFTYDYPELSALALVEAARAMSESKQPAQAVKLLKRVIRDHPGTAHAEAARKRLSELGEG